MKLGKRHIIAALLLIYIILVLCLCLLRPGPMPDMAQDLWGIPLDKVGHFLMFLPFPILAYLTFIPESNKRWGHFIVLLAVFAVGIGLAMGTEQLQSLLPYRSYDIEDFYADIFGMECSTILTAIYITFSKKA